MEEIKVMENAEEHKAKDYALALERMQNALKREQQIKIVKQMNEKSKMNVSQLLWWHFCCGTNFSNLSFTHTHTNTFSFAGRR